MGPALGRSASSPLSGGAPSGRLVNLCAIGFESPLRRNRVVSEILARAPQLHLPNWHLGAACRAQTVWNERHGFPPTAHIKDDDLVYFDSSDLSKGAEEARSRDGKRLFDDLRVEVDLCNEARVHLWYRQDFGFDIPPYTPVEDAISSWPTTASSAGVRTEPNGRFVAFAPFGLEDLLDLVVRPNERLVPREAYETKAKRWASCWPKLTVVSW
jgi:uncharacterized protein